jgi:hypothetical protein
LSIDDDLIQESASQKRAIGSVGMTYGEKWKALSDEEKRIARRLELAEEINVLRSKRASAWRRVKLPTHKILGLPQIVTIVDETLSDSRLIGTSLRRCLDAIRHYIEEIERKPTVLSGGLMERNRRRH